MHFSHCGVAGRVVYLEPVTWVDGWPRIGEPTDEPCCGQPVTQYGKPSLPEQPICCPPTSDDFSSDKLGLQWLWNHNPVDERWSLTRQPGTLQLKGSRDEADVFAVRNMLTQRLIGASGYAQVRVSAQELEIGQQAGLMAMGRDPFLFLSECPWKGARIGLFTFRGNGWAAFSDFRYIHDGPCGRESFCMKLRRSGRKR